MLTRRQLYELYGEGPDVVVRLIEQLYEHIVATEPPEVRALRLTVDSQFRRGSRPAPCEAVVDVKRFVPSMLADSGHTNTEQRVLFISLFALLCGRVF